MEEFPITEWFVRSYHNTVYHQAQQKNVRLASYARQETQKAKMKSYDVIGGTEVRKKVARHEDTPNFNMEHKRRNVIMEDFDWGTLVDDVDEIRMLNMPTSPYMVEAMNAFNRQKDTTFIAKFSAVVLTGEDADGTQAFENTQKIAASDGTAFSGLNVLTLRAIKKKFRKNEVLAEGEDATIHMAVSADELDSLLDSTEVGSIDYNNIKPLVDGNVNQYMGITFHHTELLNLEDSVVKFNVATGVYDAAGSSVLGYRRCLAWVSSGMIVTTGKDITAKILQRPDKCDIANPYIAMTNGAVRMEEKKCMEIYIAPIA